MIEGPLQVVALPWHTHLAGGTFWYLATPYAKHVHGKEEAFKEAARAAGLLIQHGVHVFSPIAHSHPIAELCNMEKDSHDLWMPLDLAILKGSNGVLVNPIPGWRISKGIEMEINAARELGLPVYRLDMDW